MSITIVLHACISRNQIAGTRPARRTSPDWAMTVRPILVAALLVFAVVAVPMIVAGRPLAAQAPVPTPASPSADQTFQRTGHPKNETAAAPAQTPPAAPEPEMPKWPVNEKPDPASVVWDSHGLRIDATNSSLHQILKDVSTATGAKVEGLGTDERVFGSYGPGQARDVLSKLLEGSGYNVLMIGDQGEGTPRQIVLSARSSAGQQTATRNNSTPADEDNEVEEQPQPQPPQPDPGNRANFPPRTPQQIEMMREQIRLQQQGQQPGQPPQPNQQPANPPN